MNALDLPRRDRPVDVVIDTDLANEIDDQFAVIWALLRPDRIRLRALLACPWASDPALYPQVDAELDSAGRDFAALPVERVGPAQAVGRTAQELRRIVALAGAEVEVWTGCAAWLSGPDRPVRSPGVDALIAAAREPRDGPLYVLAIGAATNVASALLSDPGIAERICVVWTSAYPTWWPRSNASYNLCGDLHASRVLFDSGVPLVYLPGYYVGEELRVGRLELAAHVRGRGPLGEYLWRCFDRHWMSNSTAPGFSKVIWDLICVAYVIDPDLLATDVVPSPVLSADLRWEHPAGRHVIREGYDVNRDAIFGDLYRVLAERAGSPGPTPDL